MRTEFLKPSPRTHPMTKGEMLPFDYISESPVRLVGVLFCFVCLLLCFVFYSENLSSEVHHGIPHHSQKNHSSKKAVTIGRGARFL